MTLDEALAEIAHLREQRDALQQRNSDLVRENQKRRRDCILLEELRAHLRRVMDYELLFRRITVKLAETYETAEVLSEDECLIVEDAMSIDAQSTGLVSAGFECDGCARPWDGALTETGFPSGRCPTCNSAFIRRVKPEIRRRGGGAELSTEPHDAGPTRDAELLDALEKELRREPYHRPSALYFLAKLRYRVGYRAAHAKASKLRAKGRA